jgi:hypothetical protein
VALTSAVRTFVSPAAVSRATTASRVNVSSATRTTNAGLASVAQYRYVDAVSTHIARTFVSPAFSAMAPTRKLVVSDTLTIFAGLVPVAAYSVVPVTSVAAAVTSVSPFNEDRLMVVLRVNVAVEISATAPGVA